MSLFGGLDTELSPPDVPEGISPGNQDVAYLPGSLASRPGMHRIYYQALTGQSIVYVKKYVQPNGTILNLIVTAQGNLYIENPVINPGVLTLLATTISTSAARAMSVTAFGREYIAISDGQHGLVKPLQYDGTYLDPVSQYGPGGAAQVQSIAGPVGPTVSLSRANNVVTVKTQGRHFLQVGYQAQITGVPASTIPILFTTIDNEALPGLATVNTNGPHGLVPGSFVTLTGLIGQAFPIQNATRRGGIVTITMRQPINWAPGSVVTVLNCDASFNTTTTVLNIAGPSAFTYAQPAAPDADAATLGEAGLQWPVTTTSGFPNYYEVQTVPGFASFTIAINYSDFTWGAGTVSFEWNGTFYVNGIQDQFTFSYQQYGPTASITTSSGQMQAYGQATPGIHQMQVLFLTRQGYITKPSPPVQFVANGGQYINVTNIPIGPPNVVARILAFTGAGGSNFFYIPIQALAAGQVVSTSTVVNDNGSTNAYLDFGDNTLFAATAINIPGNNLPSQVVLGPSLGVSYYASRLFWWGMANEITNFLNLDFAGGYYSGSGNLPTGWIVNPFTSLPLRYLASLTGPMGVGTVASCTIAPGGNPDQLGCIYQSAFEDAYGVPILQPNTLYTVRLLASVSAPSAAGVLTLDFVSLSGSGFGGVGFAISAMTTTPEYFSATLKTPANIPADSVLRVFTLNASVSVQFTNIQFIYTESPWFTSARASYVENPEAFDGATGVIGPVNDTISTTFQIRDELYFLTSANVYQTSDAVDSEPGTWLVRQVAANCGVLGAFAVDLGEDWAIWGSPSGLRGFAGGEPAKLSQEIQSLWRNLNPAQYAAVAVKNDPVNRRVYVCAPTTTGNLLYVLDYRENDLMSQIIAASPVKISFTGRMVSSDLGRKWTVWNVPMLTAGTLYVGGQDETVFGAANNAYYPDAAKLTDDDFGQIRPYYITYGFVNHDQEAALQLGSQRKLYLTLTLNAAGTGSLQITPLIDALANPRPARPLQQLPPFPSRDLSWGLNVAGERCFFRIDLFPLPGTTDCHFSIQKLMVRIAKHPMTPRRSAL